MNIFTKQKSKSKKHLQEMKISREELSEIRKQEQARKELENDLERDLKSEEEKHYFRELLNRDYSKPVVMFLNFSVTLLISYLAYLAMMWMLRIFGLPFFAHGIYEFFRIFGEIMCWLAALVSVFRGRSVWDDILHRFG